MTKENLKVANGVDNLIDYIQDRLRFDSTELNHVHVKTPFVNKTCVKTPEIIAIEKELHDKLEMCNKIIKISLQDCCKQLDDYLESL